MIICLVISFVLSFLSILKMLCVVFYHNFSCALMLVTLVIIHFTIIIFVGSDQLRFVILLFLLLLLWLLSKPTRFLFYYNVPPNILHENMEINLPGLPRKTEEYNTRLDGSVVRASGGDDQSLRHHRPENIQNE